MENIPVREKLLKKKSSCVTGLNSVIMVIWKLFQLSIAMYKPLHILASENIHHLAMPTDSVGREFGQSTVRMICLCHMMSETSAGEIQVTEA